MKSSRLLYGALAAAVLVWGLMSLGGDDESAIRAQLDRVSDLVSKEPGEKALESADRARRLVELFTEDFEVKLDPVGVRVANGPELARPFVGMRRQAERLDVSFDVDELEVADDFPTASMTATATVSGRVQGELRRESFRVVLAWKKQGRDWRIESLHVTERVDGGLF